jgi:HEAT repeat protein
MVLNKIKEQKMKNLLLTLVIAAVSLTALNASPDKLELNKNNYASLCQGIKSENTGLKRSAVYMAGKYSIAEATDVLIEVLKTEKDPSTKVLIALSLYKIGTEKALEAVEYLAKNDTDKEVKRMSLAILQQVEFDKAYETASIK